MTTSPYPPHESQLTASEGTQHYEFAEGYLHNGAESHYEMEPGDDPEYALPRVTMQPYEVPLSALQQAGQVITHSLPLSPPLFPHALLIPPSIRKWFALIKLLKLVSKPLSLLMQCKDVMLLLVIIEYMHCVEDVYVLWEFIKVCSLVAMAALGTAEYRKVSAVLLNLWEYYL